MANREKARELYDHAHAELPACGVSVVPWDDVPEVIRNAWIRALARQEQSATDALERAAQCAAEVAQRLWKAGNVPQSDGATECAEEIRALKPPAPQGGTDGR